MSQFAWGDWEPDPDHFHPELPVLGPAGLERDGVLLLAIPIALLMTGWCVAVQFALRGG